MKKMVLLTTEFLTNSLISRNCTYPDFLVQIGYNIIDGAIESYRKYGEIEVNEELNNELVFDFHEDNTVFAPYEYDQLLDAYIKFDITKHDFIIKIREQVENEQSRLLGAFIETNLIDECKRLAITLEARDPDDGDSKLIFDELVVEDNQKSMVRIMELIYSSSSEFDDFDESTKMIQTIIVEYLITKVGEINS